MPIDSPCDPSLTVCTRSSASRIIMNIYLRVSAATESQFPAVPRSFDEILSRMEHQSSRTLEDMRTEKTTPGLCLVALNTDAAWAL